MFFEPLSRLHSLEEVIFVFDGIDAAKTDQRQPTTSQDTSAKRDLKAKGQGTVGGAGNQFGALLEVGDVDDYDDNEEQEGELGEMELEEEQEEEEGELGEVSGRISQISKTNEIKDRWRKRLEEISEMYGPEVKDDRPLNMYPPFVSPCFEHFARAFAEQASGISFRFIQAPLEADGFIAAQGKSLKLRGIPCLIVSEDSDMVGFDTCPVVSKVEDFVHALEMNGEEAGKDMIKTISRESVAQALGVDPSWIPILASVAGNDYVSKNAAKRFLENVGSMFKGELGTSMESLALMIRYCDEERGNTALADKVHTRAIAAFGLDEKQGDNMRQAMQYYQTFDSNTSPMDSIEEEYEELFNPFHEHGVTHRLAGGGGGGMTTISPSCTRVGSCHWAKSTASC